MIDGRDTALIGQNKFKILRLQSIQPPRDGGKQTTNASGIFPRIGLRWPHGGAAIDRPLLTGGPHQLCGRVAGQTGENDLGGGSTYRPLASPPFFGASSYRPRDPLKVRALKRPRPPGADGRRRLADRTLCSANIVSVKVNLVEFSMLDSIFRINEYANELICIRFAYSNERNILEKLFHFQI